MFSQADNSDQHQRRPQGGFTCLLPGGIVSIGLALYQRRLQNLTQGVAPLATHRQKSPGSQPGMVRCPHGTAQHLFQLGIGGGWLGEFGGGVPVLQEVENIAHEILGG